MQLGNGHWESTIFNARLQPTEIALGTTSTATNLLKLDYSYGTTANNGNIGSQTITVPTVGTNTGFIATQNYNYDSLNRLKDATENITPTGGSATQSWKQTFTFDRYGNRNFDEANTTTIPRNCTGSTICVADRKVLNPTISASTNRIVQDQDNDSVNDYVFDSAGNTTRDASGKTFTYDGENKQTEVKDASNNTIGQYFYDGEGKRIKKTVLATGETTIFIYDAGGKSIAEYSTILPSTPKVNYLTADNLGSPRINTDQDGLVNTRHDYQPFGEQINRAVSGNDNVSQKFTGYKRDDESALDFSINRYYSSVAGRFTGVDPYKIVIEKDKGRDETERQQLLFNYIAKPQIWNGYSYSFNNPLRYTDPDGRRPLTKADVDIFNILQREFDKAWKAKDKDKAYAIAMAAKAMLDEIEAIPVGQEDPARLRAFFGAVSYLGDRRFATGEESGGREMHLSSRGWTVSVAAGSYKCNFFVATVYVLDQFKIMGWGANIGFQSANNPSGFPVGYAWRSWGTLSGAGDVPGANEMADGNIANFVRVNDPMIGDIAATHGNPNGNSGIYLYGSYVISANTGEGVRVGASSPGQTYLRYKP
jgi:RHS repeat-associated protein